MPSIRARRSDERARTPMKLLEVKDLSVAFGHGGRRTLAVDRISFDIAKGETLRSSGNPGRASRRQRSR